MQCRYLRGSNYSYSAGIVYHDYVIDLIDGAPSTIADIYYKAQTMGIDIDDAIIEWGDWRDLSGSL